MSKIFYVTPGAKSSAPEGGPAATEERLRAETNGYKLLLGVIVRVPTDRVREVAISFLPRRGGDSKLGWQVVSITLRQLLALLASRRTAANAGPPIAP